MKDLDLTLIKYLLYKDLKEQLKFVNLLTKIHLKKNLNQDSNKCTITCHGQ